MLVALVGGIASDAWSLVDAFGAWGVLIFLAFPALVALSALLPWLWHWFADWAEMRGVEQTYRD
jgi:hypothetical protein